jgi:hypothetical protein
MSLPPRRGKKAAQLHIAAGGQKSHDRPRRSALAQNGITPLPAVAVCAALEAAGVIFVDENGEGPGARLRKAGSK